MENLETIIKSRKIRSEYRMIPNMGKGRAVLRFDDDCGNGHNTFSITMDSLAQHAGAFGGCMHDEIAQVFPEYAHLIKWHLMSTDGPMHYIANTLYHAKPISKHQNKWWFRLEDKLIKIVDDAEKILMTEKYGEHAQFEEYFNDNARPANLDHARSTAIAPEASLEQLQDQIWLEARLAPLIDEFMADMGNVDW